MSPRSGRRHPHHADHRPDGDDPTPGGARTLVWWRRGTTWAALVATVSAASWWIAHIQPSG